MSEERNLTAVSSELVEKVVVVGDLSKLSPTERLNYYRAVCESLGLNPLTKPFDYITLNGRLTLYARKDATDQLRKLTGVSITKLDRETASGVYVVTAYAQAKDGRTDSSIGAVSIDGLRGDALANAMMKAETKAKRRVTLSIGGLGFLDETEIETIPAEVAQAEPQPEPPKPAPKPSQRDQLLKAVDDIENKHIEGTGNPDPTEEWPDFLPDATAAKADEDHPEYKECPVHPGVMMRRRGGEDGKGFWYSHRLSDGKWCNGKEKAGG